MLYVKPDYYDRFKCIAHQCEATCCAGWQIVIDEEALERYKEEKSAYRETLHRRIDWQEGVFKQDNCKRCAFLDKDNLCDMYRNLGEESLCMTCTNYPRHIEEFENVREITLSLSCPEVARILLRTNEPVAFWESWVEEPEEEFEDFDPFFYSYLEDGRRLILQILQNRTLDIGVRYGLVWHLAEEMQEIVDCDQLQELVDLYEKYEDCTYLNQAMKVLEKEKADFEENIFEAMAYSKSVFGKLYELEHLDDSWEPWLEQCWAILYANKAKGYQQSHVDFRNWNATKNNREHTEIPILSMEIILEQLMVYFIFTYFCGAVYDGNVYGKVHLALHSVYILHEMFTAKWIEQGKRLSQKDVERIVYRFSRELEHSDENLEIMDEKFC